MPFEATLSAFAEALTRPELLPPPNTQGRACAPDARRFAVYRNNVAVGLIKSLESRFPVTRRLVGDQFFRAMAGAYIAREKPRSAVLIHYGASFPPYVRGFEPARELPYLPDVAELENAWVEAYHAAEAEPLGLAALQAPDSLDDLRFTLHPAARLLRFASPAASLWAAHQGEGEPRPPEHWTPEDALVTRPDAEVFVRALPPGGYDFLAALNSGATLAEASAPLLEAGGDPGTHLVRLIQAGALAAAL